MILIRRFPLITTRLLTQLTILELDVCTWSDKTHLQCFYVRRYSNNFQTPLVVFPPFSNFLSTFCPLASLFTNPFLQVSTGQKYSLNFFTIVFYPLISPNPLGQYHTPSSPFHPLKSFCPCYKPSSIFNL